MYTLVFEEKLLPYKNAAAGKVYHGKFVMRKVCQSVAFYTSQHLQTFRLQNPFLVCFVCSLGWGAVLVKIINEGSEVNYQNLEAFMKYTGSNHQGLGLRSLGKSIITKSPSN